MLTMMIFSSPAGEDYDSDSESAVSDSKMSSDGSVDGGARKRPAKPRAKATPRKRKKEEPGKYHIAIFYSSSVRYS